MVLPKSPTYQRRSLTLRHPPFHKDESCSQRYCLPSALKRCHWGLSACMLIVSIIQIVQVTERLTQGDAIVTSASGGILCNHNNNPSMSSFSSTLLSRNSGHDDNSEMKHLITMAFTWESIWDEWENEGVHSISTTTVEQQKQQQFDPRFSHSQPPITKRQVFSNVITPNSSTKALSKSLVNPNRDVALVTHASVSKLPHFLTQVQHWSGIGVSTSSSSQQPPSSPAPVSAAIYISHKKDIHTFVDFYKQNVGSGIFDSVSFHVVLEWSPLDQDNERSAEYPHNMLRNIAIEYMPSQLLYYLMLDVDFVTPPNGHSTILKTLFGGGDIDDGDSQGSFNSKFNPVDLLRNKTLLVLPAFEQIPSEEGKKDDKFVVPSKKSELIDMYNEGSVQAFHIKTFPQGHSPTNYTKWISTTNAKSGSALSRSSSSSLFYPITYEAQYEPYVIAYRHGIPKYWEHFRGFGFDKLSQIMESHYAGYQFYVLDTNYFVVHLHHQLYKTATTHRHNDDHRKMANYALSTFGEYVIDTYPNVATWRQLKRIFGFSLIHTNDYNQREYDKLVSRLRRVYRHNEVMDHRQELMDSVATTTGGSFSSYTQNDLERLMWFATPVQDRINEALIRDSVTGSITYNNKPLDDFLKKVEPLFASAAVEDFDDNVGVGTLSSKTGGSTSSQYHPWEAFFDGAIIDKNKKTDNKDKDSDDSSKALDYTYRKVIPNALPSAQSIDIDDITVTAHASVGKLERLEIQLKRWNGPTSIAVYITKKEDIRVLLDWYYQTEFIHAQTTIHVVLEYHIGPTPIFYPQNILRNVALDYIQSDYFLALDVDFMTSYACHSKLRSLIATDANTRNSLRNTKTLMVLPAFERFEFDDQPLTIDDFPESKGDVKKMFDNGLIAPFHIDIFPPGHGPSNYTKWLSLDDGITTAFEDDVAYLIEYEHRYEPYVLGYKHARDLPRYWPFFRGFGFDKLSWLMEAHYAGFQYRVLKDFWVVHMNHAKVDSNTITDTEEHMYNLKRMFVFISYLTEAYPDTCTFDKAKLGFGSLIKRVREKTENRMAYLGKRILLAYDKKWWIERGVRDQLFLQPVEDLLNRMYVDTPFVRQWLGKVEPKLLPPASTAPMKPNFGQQAYYNSYEFEFGGFNGHAENSHNISLPKFFSMTSPVNAEQDITLVTHTSVDTLPLLLTQLRSWDGPASVAVYVGKPTDITALFKFYNENEETESAILYQTSFHVLMEDGSKMAIPHSMLRNLAVQEAKTDYILNVDVDFVTPSSNNHEKLRALLQDDASLTTNMKNDGSLYLLPAITYDIIPEFDNFSESKDDIVKALKSGSAKFSSPEPLPHGMGPTQIDDWATSLSPSSGIAIDASTTSTVYEPFALGYKATFPTYWDQYRGEDYEKVSWNLEVDSGSDRRKLKILTNCYVIGQHTNNQVRQSRLNMPLVTDEYRQNALGLFAEHLLQAGSVSWTDIEAKFGKIGGALKHSDDYYIKERVDMIRRVSRAYRAKNQAMKNGKNVKPLFGNKKAQDLLSQPTEKVLEWIKEVEPLVSGKTTATE